MKAKTKTAMTKYKPEYVPEEYLTHGFYFKSDKDSQSYYLVEVEIKDKSAPNAVARIYSIGPPENHFDATTLKSGDRIALHDVETDWIGSVDLWEKYFFLTLEEHMQMYYDERKYYGEDADTDPVASLMECINFAVEVGVREAEIKPI